MKLTKEQKEEVRNIIKEELKNYPDFVIGSEEYQRVPLDPSILQQVLFDSDSRVLFYNRELRKLDLSKIDFSGCDIRSKNLSYTNVKIDPQTVIQKSLRNTNLEGLDLSKVSFYGVCIEGANLKGTGAKINPQTIYGKSLFGTNLESLDLSEANFDGTDIRRANLKNTNAKIDLSLVCYGISQDTNLEGCYVISHHFEEAVSEIREAFKIYRKQIHP